MGLEIPLGQVAAATPLVVISPSSVSADVHIPHGCLLEGLLSLLAPRAHSGCTLGTVPAEGMATTLHAAIDEHWEAAHLTDVHERVLYRTAQQVHLLLPPQRAPGLNSALWRDFPRD